MSDKIYNSKSLRDVIGVLFKNKGLQEGMDRSEIRSVWNDLMGSMISKHTSSIDLKNGKLIIVLDSSTLRQELSFGRQKMMEVLNDHFGKRVVKEIELR